MDCDGCSYAFLQAFISGDPALFIGQDYKMINKTLVWAVVALSYVMLPNLWCTMQAHYLIASLGGATAYMYISSMQRMSPSTSSDVAGRHLKMKERDQYCNEGPLEVLYIEKFV